MRQLSVPAFLATFIATLSYASGVFACPGAAMSSCGTCSNFGSYVSSVSLGVLIGVASVGIENVLRRRR